MDVPYPFTDRGPFAEGGEGVASHGPAPWTAPGLAKQALNAELLATLVERRLHWLPAVRLALARDSRCSPRPGRPCRHERDAAGRNWDLPGFACGPIDERACPEAFRTVVDRLRDEFDIAC